MIARSKKQLQFTGKVISKNVVEWAIPRNKFTGKVVSKNIVEWDELSKKNNFKSLSKFFKKVIASKKPMAFIYRFNKYKFYKELNKSFPYSTPFLNNALNKYPSNFKFWYLPGTLYVSPILIYNKFILIEKILSELSLRGITINKIIQNEKVTMSILSKFTIIPYLNSFSKSKRFIKYLDTIEKELNKNI